MDENNSDGLTSTIEPFDNILQCSFLTISNALKQFPVLNSITPEALSVAAAG